MLRITCDLATQVLKIFLKSCYKIILRKSGTYRYGHGSALSDEMTFRRSCRIERRGTGASSRRLAGCAPAARVQAPGPSPVPRIDADDDDVHSLPRSSRRLRRSGSGPAGSSPPSAACGSPGSPSPPPHPLRPDRTAQHPHLS